MSVGLQERKDTRVIGQTEADRERIGRDFDAAIGAKIASAKDPSRNAHQEFAGASSVHLIYLIHPEQQGRRVVLLDSVVGGDLTYQFERENRGIKRTVFGAKGHEKIVSGMLSSGRSSLLNALMWNPWFDAVEQTREITHLSPAEIAIVEARGLNTPEPQPSRE